jgi:hypothetical protein
VSSPSVDVGLGARGSCRELLSEPLMPMLVRGGSSDRVSSDGRSLRNPPSWPTVRRRTRNRVRGSLGHVASSEPQPADLPAPSARAGRKFGDEAARSALAALSGPYLPWGAGVMRPAGLVAVFNDIVLKRRRRVLELGSGVSTILLVRLLSQLDLPGGFRLVAVEHDAGWARWVADQLDREGIGDNAVVVHAPLVPHVVAEPGVLWYDDAVVAAGLDAVLRGDLIDLLLVDGPPAYATGQGLARYPALPVLRDRLGPGATVVLDDVERAGEQEVLRRWEDESGLDFHRRAEDAGIAVAWTGDGPLTGPRHG